MGLEFLSLIGEKIPIENFNVFIINFVLAIILFTIGIVLGKFAKFILKKGSDKANLERTIRPSFIELFLTVVKWSIYILFINMALAQLNIPEFTNWITSILLVIPALVGALLLIVAGFAIAVYLRDLIEESHTLGWQTLSMIFYYFVIFVFIVFALKTALISQDKQTVNLIIIILTTIISAAVAYWHVVKK